MAKRQRKSIRSDKTSSIEDLFDLGLSQPRFRSSSLHKIFQNTNFAGKYVLWIDFYTIFPYDFDSVEIYLTLEGKELQQYADNLLPVSAVKAVCTTPFPNKQCLAASVEGYPDTIGIPFLFDSFSDMEKVEGFTGDVVFAYHNTEGVSNKLAIRVVNPVRFEEKNSYRDYVIEKQCTAVPGLLESDDNPKRKNIIESYPEVLHAKADLSGRAKEVPLITNVVKSESGMSDEERFELSSRVIDDLMAKGRLEGASNAYLDLYFSTDTELIYAADEGMQAYLLGNS